jgi:hypothetical protein
MNESTLSDGSQQADLVSNENADAMFGMDQAEANLVKLVDGKLVATADVEDDVEDDQLRNRYTSDEERGLQEFGQKTYETSEASLRVGNGTSSPILPTDLSQLPDVADADITAVNNEAQTNDRTQPSADQSTATATIGFQMMMPPTPATPDPYNPYPATPDAPQPPIPAPTTPGPEIPTLPGTPQPAVPEIQEPSQPDRSHEINSQNFSTFTSLAGGIMPGNADQPVEKMGDADIVPDTMYDGLQAGIDNDQPDADEGMTTEPNTGESSRPYDADANETTDYQPGERPEEADEMKTQPREMLDESSVKAG